MSDIEDLEKLAELKERGVLTEEEFNSKKAEILNKKEVETPPKKRSKLMTIVWVFLILMAIGLIFSPDSSFPKCDSAVTNKTLTSAFNQSQFARSLNLSLIEISNIQELSYDDKEKQKVRICTSDITLNTTEKVAVEYTLEQKGDSFMLTFKVKE